MRRPTKNKTPTDFYLTTGVRNAIVSADVGLIY